MPSADDLSEALREGAHGDAGIRRVREDLEPLEPLERLEFLNANILTKPIEQAAADARVGHAVDEFHVLQGDVIVTSTAFRLGVREPAGTYLVASSTCDVQPGRRETALLLAIAPKKRDEYPTTKAALGAMKPLVLYKPTRFFYLPPLPDDADDVLFNVTYLDPLYTIANDDVNIASRRASMTRFGWRLFGVVARELLIREGEDEDAMRP